MHTNYIEIESDIASLTSFKGSLPLHIDHGQIKGKLFAEIPTLKKALEKCGHENLIYRDNAKKQTTFGNIMWPVHYEIKSISEVSNVFQVDKFVLNSTFPHDTWETISIHFSSCQQGKYSAMFVPYWLFEYKFALICEQANTLPQEVTEMKGSTTLNNEVVYYDNKVSYTGNSSFYGFYVNLNVPNRSDNIKLILDFKFDLNFKMNFIVPVNNIYLVFPTSTIPRCFLTLKKKINKVFNYFRLHFLGLRLSEEKFINLEPIGKIQIDTTTHTHTRLYPLDECSSDFYNFYKCFHWRISWNRANKICKSRGLDLPAVHSVGDIERIIQQIEKQQCKASIVNFNNNQHAYHLLHRSIGIYIGLTVKVCITCLASKLY